MGPNDSHSSIRPCNCSGNHLGPCRSCDEDIDALVDIFVAAPTRPSVHATAVEIIWAHVGAGAEDAWIWRTVVHVLARETVAFPSAQAAAGVRARRVHAPPRMIGAAMRLLGALVQIVVAIRVFPALLAHALVLALPPVHARPVDAGARLAVVDVRARRGAVALPAAVALARIVAGGVDTGGVVVAVVHAFGALVDVEVAVGVRPARLALAHVRLDPGVHTRPMDAETFLLAVVDVGARGACTSESCVAAALVAAV